MTYNELSIFGRLRKVERCGPYTMFTKLNHEWGSFLSPAQVGLGGISSIMDSIAEFSLDRGESQVVLLRACP